MKTLSGKIRKLSKKDLVNITAGCNDMSFFKKIGCGIAKFLNAVNDNMTSENSYPNSLMR